MSSHSASINNLIERTLFILAGVDSRSFQVIRWTPQRKRYQIGSAPRNNVSKIFYFRLSRLIRLKKLEPRGGKCSLLLPDCESLEIWTISYLYYDFPRWGFYSLCQQFGTMYINNIALQKTRHLFRSLCLSNKTLSVPNEDVCVHDSVCHSKGIHTVSLDPCQMESLRIQYLQRALFGVGYYL